MSTRSYYRSRRDHSIPTSIQNANIGFDLADAVFLPSFLPSEHEPCEVGPLSVSPARPGAGPHPARVPAGRRALGVGVAMQRLRQPVDSPAAVRKTPFDASSNNLIKII